MAQLLMDAGMRVHTLPSPIGATRAILANKVDVVVIDVMMPGMRGDRLQHCSGATHASASWG